MSAADAQDPRSPAAPTAEPSGEGARPPSCRSAQAQPRLRRGGADGEGLPYLDGPCVRCPWRKDAPPGQFEQSRYEALRATSVIAPERGATAAAILSQPMFACHMSPPGGAWLCAGWLVVAARAGNVPVRLALAAELLPEEAVLPRGDWPELFGSYEEMAARQGRPDDGLGEIKRRSRPQAPRERP